MASIPHMLVQAVKDRRAVLVFGAGASKECKNAAGDKPPDARQMARILSEDYLNDPNTGDSERDLMTVAEMAIESGPGAPIVFDRIKKMIEGYETSTAHKALSNFGWRGIATTNYDTFIETAYRENENALQNLVPFYKDSQPFDDRLREKPNSVPYLKLHGCINHRDDRDVPLVLSHEHYHMVSKHRAGLFDKLHGWARESSVLIFVGYRIADAHIRKLLYDIDKQNRPQWYIVTPGADENDLRFWSGKGVDLLQLTFGDFMVALESEIPKLQRILSIAQDTQGAPYQKHFGSRSSASDELKIYLAEELQYLHSAIEFDNVTPEKFYSGFDTGWCGVVRKYDFQRRNAERMFYAAVDTTVDDLEPRFFLLQGPAGAGKTVALKRAAYDAATGLDMISLWLTENGALRIEMLEELFSLTGKRALVFVDQISLRSDAVHRLLDACKRRNIPVTVIAAEREADWNHYCSELEDKFPPSIYQIDRLSTAEAEALVDLLERHDCLGALAGYSTYEERVAAFVDDDRADRQLLVALHELTKAKPFEEIIREEYDRIPDQLARRLYLDIATMHQYGVLARAGAISRISGIQFSDFETKFFATLSGIVRVVYDPATGEQGYTARHSHVSKIIFGVVCSGDEEKSAQFQRIISGLDLSYSSDQRIIDGLCKGRALAKEYEDVGVGRDIFSRVCHEFPASAFLFQQAAIYEYSHRRGSLARSEELALEASRLDQRNRIYKHTLAEIKRRQAKEAASKPQKELLRNQSRSYLNSYQSNDSHKDMTFCSLLVDEVEDQLSFLPAEPQGHEAVEFFAKVQEAETRLAKAKGDYPDKPDFPMVEARLFDVLGADERAIRSLQKASEMRPRDAGVFLRLASATKRVRSPEAGLAVLRKGLDKFETDKSLNLKMGIELLEIGDFEHAEVEYHLRSSFQLGDKQHDGRFFLAEFLFLVGRMPESIELFKEIDQFAPPTFRNKAPKSDDAVTSKIDRKSGRVERRHERIFFVEWSGYPEQIFCPSSHLVGVEYSDLDVGDFVSFGVRFNRRGPVAIDVKIEME